jgi:TusA-related sulfurtransferase
MEMKEIDLRGRVCPSVLLMALREINSFKTDLRSGTMKLVFLTDNRDSTVTIPDAAANMGYEVSVAKENEYYRIDIYTDTATSWENRRA